MISERHNCIRSRRPETERRWPGCDCPFLVCWVGNSSTGKRSRNNGFLSLPILKRIAGFISWGKWPKFTFRSDSLMLTSFLSSPMRCRRLYGLRFIVEPWLFILLKLLNSSCSGEKVPEFCAHCFISHCIFNLSTLIFVFCSSKYVHICGLNAWDS